MLVCQGRAAPVLKIAWLREEKKRKKKCGSGNEEQNELVESLGKTEIKKKVRTVFTFILWILYIYIYIMQEEKKGKKKERWRKFYLTTQLLTKAVVWGEREVA